MTYGYKKKDTQAIQDQYPLVSLVRLLCFEDADEARNTCQHYSITVKEVDVSSSSSPTGKKRMELIFWKASRFTIPKDEVKGVVIPLRPRKMLRTIESKLNGITRLAVCRGEASGEGSTLLQTPRRWASTTAQTPQLSADEWKLTKEKERVAALQREEAQRKETEWKLKEDEELRQKMELKRKMEEKKRLAELARLAEEEEKAKVARQEQLELEKVKREMEEQERRRKEQEERKAAAERAKVKAEADAEEQRRVVAEAKAKRLAQQQEAKRIAEEAARERDKQALLQQQKEEEERQRKLIEELKVKARQDEERRRQKLVQEQLERDNQEKLRRAAEEARLRAEDEAKINQARKLLLWRRIRQNLAKRMQMSKTVQSLRRIDPTFSTPLDSLPTSFERTCPVQENEQKYENPDELPLADFLEELVHDKSTLSDIDVMLMDALKALNNNAPNRARLYPSLHFGLTLGLFVPEFEGVQAETAHHLLHKWMNSRFTYNKALNVNCDCSEIRFVALDGNKIEQSATIDFALFIVPPFMNDVTFTNNALVSITSRIDDTIPVITLNLDDGSDQEYKAFIQSALSTLGVQSVVDIAGDELFDFDNALGSALWEVLKTFIANEERNRRLEDDRIKQIADKFKLEEKERLEHVAKTNAEIAEAARVFLQKQSDSTMSHDDLGRCWSTEEERPYMPVAMGVPMNNVEERARIHHRSSTPNLDEEVITRSKRVFDDRESRPEPLKRSREETNRERASREFTAKLEGMLTGDIIMDMKVGESSLSDLLARVPPVQSLNDGRSFTTFHEL